LANSNLEQVSDWLTKIIVGVSLIQLGPIAGALGKLINHVAGIFGNEMEAQNQTMAGGIIGYFAILGFLGGYLSARSVVTLLLYLVPSDWLFTRSDRRESGMDEPPG
jgi:hypothetical protein